MPRRRLRPVASFARDRRRQQDRVRQMLHDWRFPPLPPWAGLPVRRSGVRCAMRFRDAGRWARLPAVLAVVLTVCPTPGRGAQPAPAMQVVLLGTGFPRPDPGRAGPSTAVTV